MDRSWLYVLTAATVVLCISLPLLGRSTAAVFVAGAVLGFLAGRTMRREDAPPAEPEEAPVEKTKVPSLAEDLEAALFQLGISRAEAKRRARIAAAGARSFDEAFRRAVQRQK